MVTRLATLVAGSRSDLIVSKPRLRRDEYDMPIDLGSGHSTTTPFCDDSGALSQAVLTKIKGANQRRRFGGTVLACLLAAVSQVLLGD